jgi:uncharacterized Zn-finger protein
MKRGRDGFARINTGAVEADVVDDSDLAVADHAKMAAVPVTGAPTKYVLVLAALTKQKVFECETCGKLFGNRGHLWTHKVLHTGVKRFGCGFCGMKFANASNVEPHERTHTGERPYGCTVCSARFGQSGTLYRHALTHTLEKPFWCTTCGQRFTQSGSAKRHRQKCGHGVC